MIETILMYVAAALVALVMLALYSCLAMSGKIDEAERRYADAWQTNTKQPESGQKRTALLLLVILAMLGGCVVRKEFAGVLLRDEAGMKTIQAKSTWPYYEVDHQHPRFINAPRVQSAPIAGFKLRFDPRLCDGSVYGCATLWSDNELKVMVSGCDQPGRVYASGKIVPGEWEWYRWAWSFTGQVVDDSANAVFIECNDGFVALVEAK